MKKVAGFIFLVIILVGAFVAWQIFGPTINNPQKKILYIITNSSYQDVKDSLKKNKMITGDFWFDKIANYAGYPQKVKPGKYKIKDGMSLYHLVKMLRNGQQVPINLVITKLRTKEDLAKKIASNFEADSLEVINFLNNNDSLDRFDLDSNTVMTAVIPNTYTYTWTTPVQKIFKKLYDEKLKFWNEERLQKARHLGISPTQVYILASIIEEETNKQEDKGKIASVYLNRMKKGMRLSADPTVKFAMKDFGLKRIYHKHLEFDSPYNTYRNAGLPPGPICTPSIKTIDAVLNSPDTDYLFFVARSDFSGFSDFATNYQQHLVYAKQYQQALDSLIRSRQSKEMEE